MRFSWLAFVLSASLLTGCGTMVTNPVSGESEFSVMSESEEVDAGRKGHEEVLKEYKVYDKPALQTYVNQLGQKLAAKSHRSNLTWHFTVLDSPEINAFALPGGYIYVTRGIMAHLNSEAELAGVIGHEIGHVTARHGAKRATQQTIAGIGGLLVGILGEVANQKGYGTLGQLGNDLYQAGAAGYIMSYGREQELQADSLGADYLSRNTYDPRKMINVIGVLKDQELFSTDEAKAQGRPVTNRNDWLSSHPSNDKRLQDIQQFALQYPISNYRDEGRTSYLQLMQGLTFGDSEEQGYVRGSQFYHVPLGIAITAPQGWRIQNSADELVLVNPSSEVYLVLRPVPAKAGNTQAEVINSMLKNSKGQTSSLTINGMAATRFNGSRVNQKGQTQKLDALIVTGPHNKHYLLQRIAKTPQALNNAAEAVQTAEMSFRPLTDEDRKNAKPWGLKLVPYPKGGFVELAKTSPLPNAEKQLRLINGFYKGGEPAVGQPVKVVVTQ